jgi:DNA-binding transcriptional LysR family regulator
MDLRRLEVFCKVYELKSFSRAAEACLLSQPTVSEHIRHLETHLDVRLFDLITLAVCSISDERQARLLNVTGEKCLVIWS